jgi:arylsulfatase A-like enzyme
MVHRRRRVLPRRRPLKRTLPRILEALLGTACLWAAIPATVVAAAPARPNFILIVSDDQAESTYRFMPRIDQLRDEGVSFTSYFATNPVCGPSRASLLTGRYPHNHGVLDNIGPNGPKAFRSGGEASNVATWLEAAGYRTALFGKYMNDYGISEATTYAPAGWTDWCAKLDQGVGYFDFSLLCNGDVVTYSRPQGIHELEALGDAAAAFLEDAAAGDEPFFMYLAPFSPHANNKEDPPEPPAAFDGIYEGLGAPRGPAFNESDIGDKPPWLRNQPLIDDARAAEIDLLYTKTAETVAGLDAAVEALLAVVDDLGLTDSTYVFYVSDHGFQFGEHRLLRKGTPFEESVHVPLVVSGPGVDAGASRDELVANIDVAPTILELAGVADAPEVDGRSLAPLLDEPAAAWRKGLLLENWKLADPPSDISAVFNWRALRTDTYKVSEYNGPDDAYDLENDPFELENLLFSASETPGPDDRLWLEQLACCRGLECSAREDDGPAPTCEPDDQTCVPACSDNACGDATGDNRVSVTDAQRILVSAAASRTCSRCRCDLDGNGDVSVRDALSALILATRGTVELSCPACP